MATSAKWNRTDDKRGEWIKTEDGYTAGYHKLEGVSVDGYLATVIAPQWSYTARCATAAAARYWCVKTVRSDRQDPRART